MARFGNNGTVSPPIQKPILDIPFLLNHMFLEVSFTIAKRGMVHNLKI